MVVAFKYYVNIEIRNGSHLWFGDYRTNIRRNSILEFINYITNEAIFSVHARYVINNMNYLSTIYLSTEYDDDTVIKTNNNKPLFIEDSEWLYKNYRHIHDALLVNKQVIVAWAMIAKHKSNKDGYHTVNLIETRIPRNNLSTLLLNGYETKIGVKVIPESMLVHSEHFWLTRDVFKNCKNRTSFSSRDNAL